MGELDAAAAAMHEGEFEITDALARELVDTQLPACSALALRAVRSSGTVHVVFRLGDDLAVRLPRTPGCEASHAKELTWVPRLAPHLPLAVPLPLHLGVPTAAFPSSWLVSTWLEGSDATLEALSEPHRAVDALVAFTDALHAVPTDGGPAPGHHNGYKAEPLERRDTETRAMIESLADDLDIPLALAAWDAALTSTAAATWVHADLQASNLLASNGTLRGVVDFGCLCVGDPAIDLLPAWSLFEGDTRRAYREATGVDEATWSRGRGWAITFVMAIPYYRTSNPAFAALAARTVTEALADFDGR